MMWRSTIKTLTHGNDKYMDPSDDVITPSTLRLMRIKKLVSYEILFA